MFNIEMRIIFNFRSKMNFFFLCEVMVDIKTTDQELYCASNYSMGGVTQKRLIAPNGDFKVHLVSVIIILDRNIILPRY